MDPKYRICATLFRTTAILLAIFCFSCDGGNGNDGQYDEFERIVTQLDTPLKAFSYMQSEFEDEHHDGCISYTPEEFYNIGKGDCKDYATFFSYVLAEHGYDVEIITFFMNDSDGNSIGGHTFAVFTDHDGHMWYQSGKLTLEIFNTSLEDLIIKMASWKTDFDSIRDWAIFSPGSTDVCVD